MSKEVERQVFTDGACSGNPGPGGWAWVTDHGAFDQGGDPQTTNQRMELQAVLEALRSLEGPLKVHSDSTYVVNCFNDGWYRGWIQRGWRTAAKKPVANRDIWEPLIELFLERQEEVSFVWVKGHSGNRLNEQADALAVEACQAIQRSMAPPGEALGDVLDPPVPWPIERAVSVFGPNELDEDLSAGLVEAIDGLDPDYDIVVSGLRRGAELEAAELALARRVPVAVVVPFANPAARWPGPDLRRFEAAAAAASWVIDLALDLPPGKAIAARDRWLEQAGVGAIVVGEADRADRLEELGLGVVLVEAD